MAPESDVRNPHITPNDSQLTDSKTPEDQEWMRPFNRYLVSIPCQILIEATGDDEEEALREAEAFVHDYEPYPFEFTLPGPKRQVQVWAHSGKPQITEELNEEEDWRLPDAIQIPRTPVDDEEPFDVRRLTDREREVVTVAWSQWTARIRAQELLKEIRRGREDLYPQFMAATEHAILISAIHGSEIGDMNLEHPWAPAGYRSRLGPQPGEGTDFEEI